MEIQLPTTPHSKQPLKACSLWRLAKFHIGPGCHRAGVLAVWICRLGHIQPGDRLTSSYRWVWSASVNKRKGTLSFAPSPLFWMTCVTWCHNMDGTTCYFIWRCFLHVIWNQRGLREDLKSALTTNKHLITLRGVCSVCLLWKKQQQEIGPAAWRKQQSIRYNEIFLTPMAIQSWTRLKHDPSYWIKF